MNKRRFGKMKLTALLCGLAASLLGGCKGTDNPTPSASPVPTPTATEAKPDFVPSGKDPVAFTTLTLSESNCSAELNVLRFRCTEDTITVSFGISYLESEEDNYTPSREYTGDAALKAEVEKLLGDVDLLSWNGFSGYDPDVLDGEGFTLECTLADGTELSANGSNSFPKHYYVLRDKLWNLAHTDTVTGTTFTDKCYTLTVPESWVGNVQIEYYDDFTVFEIAQEGTYSINLMRIDYHWYAPSQDKNTTVLGKLIPEEGEELYLSAYNLNPYLAKDKGTELQHEIIDAFPAYIETISEQVQASGGYRLEAIEAAATK